jgi:glycine cleavage system H protein
MPTPAPSNARFAKSHEWILTGEAESPVGISEHAQAELGDVVYIELPEVGRTVTAGESIAVIESVKAASAKATFGTAKRSTPGLGLMPSAW